MTKERNDQKGVMSLRWLGAGLHFQKPTDRQMEPVDLGEGLGKDNPAHSGNTLLLRFASPEAT